MDSRFPPPSSAQDADVTEGHSVGPLARLAGAFCFLTINPLFIYVWIDDPKFVQGPIDFAEIFMAIVTAGMLFLGVCGLVVNFSKTRVSADAIEWRFFRRRRLELDRVRHVEHVVRLTVMCVPVVSIMRLVTDDSKRMEIVGGTEELYQSFLRIQSQYPT